ncbi:MAG: PEP-CTERM sorting domain-containing protein [Sandarakinorhabdus sp.]|nr:PEP-CTERM sorting domain-containing protein [Sandarakinorhabdus sp.]
MKKIGFVVAASFPMISGSVSAAVIEDFETGGYGSAWISNGGNALTFNAGAAHDGSFGATGAGSEPEWAYRTDAASSIASGSVLSAWARNDNGGRFYLGFAADSTGANSFVLAPNTGQLLFQNNEGYGFANATSTGFSFVTGQWYFATVSFGSSIVGSVYGADGTTLLGQLTASGLSRGTSGGVALRGYGTSFDTIGNAAIPEPASWAMMIAGFGLVGAVMRRRHETGRETAIA